MTFNDLRHIPERVGSYLLSHIYAVLFIIATTASITAFISINLSLYQPTDTDYRTEQEINTQSTRFDTTTILKVQNLNTIKQSRTDTIPSATRTNPFYE